MNQDIYLCVYVREFPAQALLRLRPELRSRAVVVMEREAPFQQVCSLNKYARALGIMTGMSRTEMDSFPSAFLLKRSWAEEEAARAALLECAGSFSPRIEECPGEGVFSCVLDISGTEKLFGSCAILADRVQREFALLSVACSVAVSTSFYTAVSLARAVGPRKQAVIVSDGNERHALAPLPLSVLNISAEHAETFSQWGVSTLGILAMLPEKDLVARLGQEGKRLRQLARGECPHLFQPIEPVLALEENLELDTPVDVLDSLLFGVGLMLEQLITRATARVLSLAAVSTELGLEGGDVHTRTVRAALPSNEKHLWLKLLHLDWIAHPPSVGVVSLRLRAETGTASKLQLGLFSPQLPEPGLLDVTLARIRSVVGEDRVGRVELKDTHGPESFDMRPFSVISHSLPKEQQPRTPAAVMRCLRPAEKTIVTIRNRQPHLFYFRGIAYEVERCYGPWRAAGGWWEKDHWSIEQWDIVARSRDKGLFAKTSGVLCCCMIREIATERWQIETLYD